MRRAIEKREDIMGPAYEIEHALLSDLEQIGPSSLETMVRRLPSYSWSQVFAAVDRLSREGLLTLQRPTRFDYLLSVPPRQPGAVPDPLPSEAEGRRSYRLTGS